MNDGAPQNYKQDRLLLSTSPTLVTVAHVGARTTACDAIGLGNESPLAALAVDFAAGTGGR